MRTGRPLQARESQSHKEQLEAGETPASFNPSLKLAAASY
jgi:hypothetical protein